MSQHLILHLALDQDTAEWLLVDDHGAATARMARGALRDARSLAQQHSTTVILSGTPVTRTTCELPVSGKKLAQALPYALEDQFASDVDALHFAAGNAHESGVREVATLDDQTLASALEQLEATGISPRAVHTLHDTLAPLEGFVQLLVLGDEVWLRGGHGDITALKGIDPITVLTTWRASQDDEDSALNVRLYIDDEGQRRFVQELDELRASEADIKTLPDGVLAFAARQLRAGHGINLLQGRYAPASDIGARLRRWSVAAVLAAIACTLGLMGQYADYRALTAESARLDADLTQLLRRIPGSNPNTNVEGQVVAQIRRLTGSNTGSAAITGAAQAEFLPTMGVVSEALGRVGDNAALDSISYRSGVLDIRVNVPNAQALDRLTQAIGDDGTLSAQIQRTVQGEDQIESFVQIRSTSP